MARLTTEGFELGDYGQFVCTNSSICVVQTTTKRSGSYALELKPGSANVSYTPSAAASEFYVRFGVNFQSGATATDRDFFRWLNASTTLGFLSYIWATGQVALYTGTGTLVATSGGSLALNTWYLMEIRVKIADSGGVIEVKVDGASFGSFTGDTKPGSATTITVLQLLSIADFGASTQKSVFIDDVAINDTTGGSDNGYPGDGAVIALLPNADGDSSQFVGSDGNSTSNYLLVDETPHNSDTDYVESGTSTNKDLYNLAACGLSSVTILRVWGELRAKSTTTATTVKVLLKSGGTTNSSTQNLPTSYGTVRGADVTTDPSDAAAWTTTDLDALQAGVEVV